PIVAPEEPGRLNAGEDRAVGRRDVPHGRDLVAVIAVGHALGRVRPGLAEIVRAEDRRAEPGRATAGVDRARRRIPLEVVDRPALAEWPRDRPVGAVGPAVEDEGTL